SGSGRPCKFILAFAFCLVRFAFCFSHCLLLSAYCLLLSAYCLLLSAYCLLLSAYCLLLSAYCLLLSAYCLLLSFHSHLARQMLDESQSPLRQHVARGREVPPDGRRARQLRLGLREGLDGQPAVVAERYERQQDSAPLVVPGAGNASVVFRNV